MRTLWPLGLNWLRMERIHKPFEWKKKMAKQESLKSTATQPGLDSNLYITCSKCHHKTFVLLEKTT